jgi:peptide/nickel transport system ATP-binding protein
MTPPLLQIENLRVDFCDHTAVRGLSLTMGRGQTLGVVGESGSGKSATSLAILRLLPVHARVSGRILLEGRDLLALSEPEMCAVRGGDIGIVFQEPMTALDPLMSIGDQVAEAARRRGRLSRREVDNLARRTLAEVGLPPDIVSLDRYPHQLSGGQRQRVAIAAAIALAPRLLIADEPTTALDVTVQAQIMALLKGLVRERGLGLIFISHDLALVAEAADQIVVMKDAGVVAAGKPLDILADARHPYVQRLKAAAALPTPAPTAINPDLVLEAEGLVRSYPAPRRWLGPRPEPFLALDGVGVTLHRGECLGIVGESGSGKSTLLRTLLALDKPQAGTVHLGGKTLDAHGAGADRRLRRQIQAVFQDPYGSFNPSWRVEQLVAEPLDLLDPRPSASERRQRVATLLAQVGLPADAIDRPPSAFSGGQRQRIAIARALAISPDIIAFDEATSALDVSTRAEILKLLAELKQTLRLSYLFVTHDLALVRAIADRIVVMQAGRVVETGRTADIFAGPKHPYTTKLLAATPDLERVLTQAQSQTYAAG